jgi:hypothetical protein
MCGRCRSIAVYRDEVALYSCEESGYAMTRREVCEYVRKYGGILRGL